MVEIDKVVKKCCMPAIMCLKRSCLRLLSWHLKSLKKRGKISNVDTYNRKVSAGQFFAMIQAECI